MEPQFRHEYERRLRIAVVGCGGHAYRNILPALNYLPVDLLATCDAKYIAYRAERREIAIRSGPEQRTGRGSKVLHRSSHCLPVARR